MSSPPDGLGGRPPKSRLPEPASVGAPRAASRDRLRRAAPVLDRERYAGASHPTGIDSARLVKLLAFQAGVEILVAHSSLPEHSSARYICSTSRSSEP